MKKISLLSLLLFLGFQSCENLEDIKTVDLNTELSKEIPVDISEEDPSEVNETFNLSALNDSEISRYRDKIKEFEVNRVSYQILQYSGDAGITMTGTFKLGPVDVDINEIDLKALSDSGELLELDLFDSELRQLANEIDQKDEISGSVTGTVSGKPVNFIVKFTLDVSFRAEVL